MDPNAMLTRMRALLVKRRTLLDAADAAAEAGDHGTEDEKRRGADVYANEIADCAEALDESLSQDGFLPDDWRAGDKPRIEIVSYRDPDNETELRIFVDGQERTDFDWCEADPGAGHVLSEWRQTGAEYASSATPAAAERIREFWSAGEASEYVEGDK